MGNRRESEDEGRDGDSLRTITVETVTNRGGGRSGTTTTESSDLSDDWGPDVLLFRLPLSNSRRFSLTERTRGEDLGRKGPEILMSWKIHRHLEQDGKHSQMC